MSRSAAAVTRHSSHQGPLRLTRRGRIVLVLVVAALAFVALGLARSSSQAATASGGPATRAVTVVPGQTLWQIAVSVAPSDDPRDTVLRIEALNPGLRGPIQAGQQLVVPA